jgi:two-component system sensor histidine kinase CiaH
MILLDNAVKFTQPGGAIDVEIFRREKNWICSVTDNGIGISEASQAHIFERFFREKQVAHGAATGAGLGLAIAKSIVESHRGSITLLDSRPGRTIFTIAIPVFEKNTIPGELQANSFSVRI